jgi:hypothetical protein
VGPSRPPFWRTMEESCKELGSVSLKIKAINTQHTLGFRENDSEFRNPTACVFITAVRISKLFAWGEGDSGGHVVRETTSRGLCGTREEPGTHRVRLFSLVPLVVWESIPGTSVYRRSKWGRKIVRQPRRAQSDCPTTGDRGAAFTLVRLE